MANMNNTIINLSNINGVDVEQLQALLAEQGIVAKIKVASPKTTDKIQYNDEEKTIGICKYDASHEFILADLSEEELKNAKQSGLCPHCFGILQQAKMIKEITGRTRRVTDNQPSAEKPGYKIRELIKKNLSILTDEQMMQLQDAEYCKVNFKLRYALLMEITDKTVEEIREMRMDKGHPRYSPQVYVKEECLEDGEIISRQYLMTNDLYARNLAGIEKYFSVENK